MVKFLKDMIADLEAQDEIEIKAEVSKAAKKPAAKTAKKPARRRIAAPADAFPGRGTTRMNYSVSTA